MRAIGYALGGVLKWVVGFIALLVILDFLDPSLCSTFVTIIKQLFAVVETGLSNLLSQGI